MEPKAWIAVSTTLVVFSALWLRRRAPTDLLFLGGLVVVTLCGVISPDEALQGFASPSVLAIGGLLVCAGGLRATGVLDWFGHWLLGTIADEGKARTRLAFVLVPTSAFVLNTALVAMFMPVVIDWCRKRGVSPSRLLIPLSYLVILGGVLTLVGTSTTLVVNSKLQTEYRDKNIQVNEVRQTSQDAAEIAKTIAFADAVRPMQLFEIGKVGIYCAIVGALVLLLLARFVLPDRQEMIDQLGDQRREYLVEMHVRLGCRMIGQTVEDAGLRHLPGLFLIEIGRKHEVIAPVSPRDRIRAGDRLVFTGIVSTIVDLEKIPGLVPAADVAYELHGRQTRHLTEVVLSRTCPIVGFTVRDASFRRRYNAAVVAVHRSGVRITNKIGDIVLEPGDTLLLQTRGEFVTAYRNSPDFFLVSAVEGSTPRRHDRALIAAVLGLGLILWLSLTSYLPQTGFWAGFSSPAIAATGVAGLMVLSRCLQISAARTAIDLQLLLTIAGALGLAEALEKSGAAFAIAEGLIKLVGENPMLLLAVIYVLTMIATEMITNNAVAAIMLPLAISTAWQANYNPRPFIIAIALAASLSFLTPIGYQTNLMVMGPGGYRPTDYLRAGFPVAIAVAVTAILVIPRIWSFLL